jgi:protein SCO1/2
MSAPTVAGRGPRERELVDNRAMSNRYWISVGAIALAAAVAGVYVARLLSQPAVPGLESGTVLPQPRVLKPFELVDTHGAPASQVSLTGHPTLVFFGFTHCPDVCPTTLALLGGVQKQVVRDDPRIAGLKVALISVDPERDTPEQMGRYISSFNGDFIGLTGTPPGISAATRSFGVAASRVDLGGGNYTMDHSATVFALDSQARIVAVFTPPLRAPALARDIVKLAPQLTGGP